MPREAGAVRTLTTGPCTSRPVGSVMCPSKLEKSTYILCAWPSRRRLYSALYVFSHLIWIHISFDQVAINGCSTYYPLFWIVHDAVGNGVSHQSYVATATDIDQDMDKGPRLRCCKKLPWKHVKKIKAKMLNPESQFSTSTHFSIKSRFSDKEFRQKRLHFIYITS